MTDTNDVNEKGRKVALKSIEIRTRMIEDHQTIRILVMNGAREMGATITEIGTAAGLTDPEVEDMLGQVDEARQQREAHRQQKREKRNARALELMKAMDPIDVDDLLRQLRDDEGNQ